MEKHTRLQVFKRAAISGSVLIHDDTRLYEARIGNLSAGGIFLNNLTLLNAGTNVRVTIKASGLATPVQAMGKVVRVEEALRRGLAVEFTSISNHSRETLHNCVQEARLQEALKVV